MTPGTGVGRASLTPMGKASRNQRRRSSVRSAKKTRNNNLWYGLVAVLVIVGVGLIVFQSIKSREDDVGPRINTSTNAGKPTPDSHWHAALGVYDCDKWLSDGTGDGVWAWPGSNGKQILRVGTQQYAGMHSHEDGLIHMEPSASEDAGKNATVGRYFRYGGWSVDADGYTFLGTTRKNGDTCGDQPGKFIWGVGKFGGDPANVTIEPRSGNPSSYKLGEDEVVVLAFVPEGKTLADIGLPPSVKNLVNPSENGSASQMQTPTQQVPAATSAPPAGVPAAGEGVADQTPAP